MDTKSIILGLIMVLIVSLAIAGIYATEMGTTAHDVSSDRPDVICIKGSHDVCHVVGVSQDIDHISKLDLTMGM